jgi:hypothetical protein
LFDPSPFTDTTLHHNDVAALATLAVPVTNSLLLALLKYCPSGATNLINAPGVKKRKIVLV